MSPAGAYLTEHGVPQSDFNSYGARRGNHEVMMRGTFANIRIKNAMVKNENGSIVEGGYTVHQPSRRAHVHLRRGDALPGRKAARSSSSPARNTAPAPRATGRRRARLLLGVRAVVAESFERIHRSNLIGMGVLPLQFADGQSWNAWGSPAPRRSRSPALPRLDPVSG